MSARYDRRDVGCWADGAHGHDFVRQRMADILEGSIPRSTREIVRALREPMSDDASEEDDFFDAINVPELCNGVMFSLCDGDLVVEEVEED